MGKQKITTLQRSVLYWVRDTGPATAAGGRRPSVHSVHSVQSTTPSPHHEEDEMDHGAKHHTVLETEEVVTKHGVPQDIFCRYMKREIESTESCLSLPFTLLLVISYAMVAINHDSAEMVNAVEDSINGDIADNANFAYNGDYQGFKAIEDVNTHADFWSWFQKGFMPLIWAQSYQLSEGRNMSEPYAQQITEKYTRKERGVLLNYNRIVLGVRLSQERDEGKCKYQLSGQCKTPSRECSYKPLEKLYNKRCVGGHGHELEPEIMEARKTVNPTRIHWLYINDDVDFIQQQLIFMEKSGWLDEQTRKIEIAMPVYNGEYGLHTMFICAFFFSRGGHIWKDIIPLSAFAQAWTSWRSMFYDATWVFCLLYVIVVEGIEVVGVIRDFGLSGLYKEYLSFWNGVDWISVFSGLGICAMFFTNLQNIHKMNDGLADLGNIDEISHRTQYRKQGLVYVEALEVEMHFAYIFRLVQCAYPLVIFLRLFKAFGAQPRLAVVTKTLSNSWVDLVHFFIIFASVFFTYMVAGVVLFGREVPVFTTWFRSFITCFRALFGDFDWEELSEVGRLDAFMWFLPFMILIVLILLNMLIAIVMDAHAEVIGGMEYEDDILTLTRKALRTKSGKWKRANVPYTDIQKALEAKMEATEKRRKEEDQGQTLGDELESGNSDEHRATFGKKLMKKGSFNSRSPSATQTNLPDPEDMVTVSSLKDLFPAKMKTAQAKQLIKESILWYYVQEKKAGDVREVSQAISVIDYRTKRLREAFKDRMSSEGLAINNPEKVDRLTRECHLEEEATREELTDWLDEDEEDVCLPQHWLRPASLPDDELEDEEVEVRTEAGKTSAGNGLLKIVKHFKTHEGGAGTKVSVDFVVGGHVQLLSDERLILKACRDAGIAKTYDHHRRRAAGKMCRIIGLDDDGTVKCRVPDVGDVWFAKTAFAPTLKRKHEAGMIEDWTGVEPLERKIKELEGEVEKGKEVVEECLQALKSLHDDLMKMKADKRKGVEKFNLYRQQAVALQRGNVAEKERFKECQTQVREITTERDSLFERVKEFAKENRELEERVAAAAAAAAQGPMAIRDRDHRGFRM